MSSDLETACAERVEALWALSALVGLLMINILIYLIGYWVIGGSNFLA